MGLLFAGIRNGFPWRIPKDGDPNPLGSDRSYGAGTDRPVGFSLEDYVDLVWGLKTIISSGNITVTNLVIGGGAGSTSISVDSSPMAFGPTVRQKLGFPSRINTVTMVPMDVTWGTISGITEGEIGSPPYPDDHSIPGLWYQIGDSQWWLGSDLTVSVDVILSDTVLGSDGNYYPAFKNWNVNVSFAQKITPVISPPYTGTGGIWQFWGSGVGGGGHIVLDLESSGTLTISFGATSFDLPMKLPKSLDGSNDWDGHIFWYADTRWD
jgi:hypothetical protein